MALAHLNDFKSSILSRKVKLFITYKIEMKLKSFLAVFDFDYTLANDNSDAVAIKLLKIVPNSTQQLIKVQGWNVYMNEIFRLLHEKKITEDEMKKAVASIPPVPNVDKMLPKLKEMDSEVIIISDANTVFINEWLKAYNLTDYIDRIYTNPSKFIDGRLHLKGYHQQSWCEMCPRNMCKSCILFKYLAERKSEGTVFRFVSFCGDGDNDLCPCLQLRADDFIFARKHFSLDRLLKIHPVKANVILWENTDIILHILQELDLTMKENI